MALSPSEREGFFELTQNASRFGTDKHVNGIFATNAIPAHSYSRDHSAIFLTSARLNHAWCASSRSLLASHSSYLLSPQCQDIL